MRHARKAVTVAALAILVGLTPLLISLSAQEPRPQDREPGRQEKPKPRGTAKIRLLGVNDLHGNLERSAESAGTAYLAAQLDRHGRANTIRVHSGDMVSASPLVSARYHDEPTVLAMNALGFGAAPAPDAGQFTAAVTASNPHIKYFNSNDHGYNVVEVTPTSVVCIMRRVVPTAATPQNRGSGIREPRPANTRKETLRRFRINAGEVLILDETNGAPVPLPV